MNNKSYSLLGVSLDTSMVEAIKILTEEEASLQNVKSDSSNISALTFSSIQYLFADANDLELVFDAHKLVRMRLSFKNDSPATAVEVLKKLCWAISLFYGSPDELRDSQYMWFFDEEEPTVIIDVYVDDDNTVLLLLEYGE